MPQGQNAEHQSRSSIPHVPIGEALGQSEIFLEFKERLSRVARVDRPVLLIGERGTGKELAVSKLHYLSSRWQGPLVALNCAAIPESLLESELFGLERGTATGVTAKQGKFAVANGGTLFLDEIGDMSPSTQAKVLRALQEGEFIPVGGEKPVRVDVRVLSATNRNLKKAIADGKFREDLLYRLNVFTVNIPSLRDRKEDIIPLCDFFLNRMPQARSKQISGFADEARVALVEYSWPGNVRELENVLQRASIICPGNLIDKDDLSLDVLDAGSGSGPHSIALKEVERLHILKVLRGVEYNKASAARLLGISRSTLWAKMKEYTIDGESE